MDVKLNVLKYPQLGQLAELLVLSLTGLRNTGVTIPSTAAGKQDPQSVPLTVPQCQWEKKTVTHTHSYTHIYINGNTHTHNKRMYTCPRITHIGSTVFEASLCSNDALTAYVLVYPQSLVRLISWPTKWRKVDHTLMGK